MTDLPVEIRKSKRRTISLTVTKDLGVLVKAPLSMPNRAIEAFLAKHRAWIEKHIILQKEQNEKAPAFSREQIELMKNQALLSVAEKVRNYSAAMGVVPAGLKITSAVTRWGSCSGRNRLCFSYRIVLLPHEAVDYIEVHELAHIREKNHGAGFYAEVAKIMPDYRRRIALLKQAQRKLGL